MLSSQPDVEVLSVKDYIAQPKPNGYRRLHALVRVPVHLSDRVVPVTVELQLRPVAIDFWARLEHKIYYKYRESVPADLLAQLQDAPRTAADLDDRMEKLHVRTHGDFTQASSSSSPTDDIVRQLQRLREARETNRFV